MCQEIETYHTLDYTHFFIILLFTSVGVLARLAVALEVIRVVVLVVLPLAGQTIKGKIGFPIFVSFFFLHNLMHQSFQSYACAARHRSEVATSRVVLDQTRAAVRLVLEGKWVVQSI